VDTFLASSFGFFVMTLFQGIFTVLRGKHSTACRRRLPALYLYWVTWEHPGHPGPGRARPMEP
jgi:hypothetical protein